MPQENTHPTAEVLKAFLHGRLTENEQAEAETHIRSCEACCRRLASVAPDNLSEQLAEVPDDGHSSVPAGATRVADLDDTRSPQSDDRLPPELRDHPRYHVEQVLGRGGMGTVYRARHRLMERDVALKVINAEWAGSEELIQRFHNEVRASALLNHPNIVRAYDAERAGSLYFLAMEFVDGISLAEYTRRKGCLSGEETLRVIRQAARALRHAFEHGVVHRDIKPQNMMVTREGRIRILDFGLARFLRREDVSAPRAVQTPRKSHRTTDALTQIGSLLGTPDYIAPEQAVDAHQADIRSDIYSLGCTAHFLMTGQPPFAGGTAVQKVMSHQMMQPQRLLSPISSLSRPHAAVLSRMLQRDPADRLQTPEALIAAVDAALEETSGQDSEPDTAPTPNPAPVPGSEHIQQTPDAAVADEASLPPAPVRMPATTTRRSARSKTERRVSPLLITTVAAVPLLALLALVYWFRPTEVPEQPTSPIAGASAAPTDIGTSATVQDPRTVAEPIALVSESVPFQTVEGSWENDGEVLTADAATDARIAYRVTLPPEYRYEVEFTRLTGVNSVALIFTVEGRQCVYDIDAWNENAAGLQQIDGRTLQDGQGNPTRTDGIQLQNGRRYSAAVEVRRGRIEAFLDGRSLFSWAGDPGSLSNIPTWQLPPGTSIGLGAWNARTVFHSARIIPLSR